jgi:hypothetical protein
VKKKEDLHMERIPINPGSVDWSGENPGMYLKETPDGPFVTLISFFRVVLSPHGRGHAAFLLLDPHGDGTASGKPNLCITDNEPLARYLRDGFATYFAAFKGAKGLAQCRFERGSQFIASGDARTTYTERFRGEGGEVSLTWEPLTDAFMVELGLLGDLGAPLVDLWRSGGVRRRSRGDVSAAELVPMS